MGDTSSKADWAGVAVSLLIILGGVGGVYSSLSSDISVLTAKNEALKEKINEIDDFQNLLSGSVIDLKADLVRQESKTETLIRSYDRLDSKMDVVLNELKIISDSVVKLGVRHDINKENEERSKKRNEE